MPFKDKEVRKKYNRKYMRIRRSHFSFEEKENIKKQNREHKRIFLSSKNLKQKEEFYKHKYIVARKSGQYDDMSEQAINAYHSLRNRVIIFLGGRCANPNCKWVNDDGTFGCVLKDCLQIDHVNGGGRKEKEKGANLLRKVLKDSMGLYQLLCANCNWIKRVKNNEVRVSAYRNKKAA